MRGPCPTRDARGLGPPHPLPAPGLPFPPGRPHAASPGRRGPVPLLPPPRRLQHAGGHLNVARWLSPSSSALGDCSAGHSRTPKPPCLWAGPPCCPPGPVFALSLPAPAPGDLGRARAPGAAACAAPAWGHWVSGGFEGEGALCFEPVFSLPIRVSP